MPQKVGGSSRSSDQDEGEDETTLLSVVRRMSSTGQKQSAKTVDISVRKTPFGSVRIPSGTHVISKQSVNAKKSEEILFTLLPSIRQRTRHGKVQWNSRGLLSYTSVNEGLTLLLDLRTHTVELCRGSMTKAATDVELKDTNIYQLAMQWLQRYSRNVVVCTFRTALQASTCTIYANGPQPDFQLSYEQKRVANRLSKITTIRISRQLGDITLWVSISSAQSEEQTICTHSTTLPLHYMQVNKPPAFLLDDVLRRNELDLVFKTLALVDEVDTIYATISRSHLRRAPR